MTPEVAQAIQEVNRATQVLAISKLALTNLKGAAAQHRQLTHDRHLPKTLIDAIASLEIQCDADAAYLWRCRFHLSYVSSCK